MGTATDVDVYHSYTQALRHPVIIGHVAGWRLPWALSASQLGAVAGTSGLLLMTRPVWAHLGSVGDLAVFVLTVSVSGWAVRHWRIEGRSPFRVMAGTISLVYSPGCRLGVRGGSPVTPPRPSRGDSVGLLVDPESPLVGRASRG
jgi:hypothetical protein